MDEQKRIRTIIDKSTKNFTKVVTELVKATGELGSLAEGIEALTSEIEFKQSALDAIGEQTKTDVRLAKAELSLKVTENEAKVLADLLKKNGLATITTGDLYDLQLERDQALVTDAEATASKVKAAESTLHANYGGQLSTLKADHKVDVAQKDADISAQSMRITFMADTINSLKETIEADRTARVDIAKAEATKQAVTVNTSSK